MFRESFFNILKIKDHQLNKKSILTEISKLNRPFFTKDSSVNYNSFISNTNWDLPDFNLNPNWLEFSLSHRDKIKLTNFIKRKYKSKNIGLANSWFNQYYPNSGSDHPFHDHEDIQVVCVYYVELKNISLRTVLINPKTNKEVIPKVNEGDLLIFGGNIKHKSPRNFEDTRKTVITFNFDLFE